MITRVALFKGSVSPGQTDAFRAAVRDRLVPLWTRFPGQTDVRVMFGEDRDEGAPDAAHPRTPLSRQGSHGGGA